MYTIKRQSLFTDILKLEDENNNSKEIAFSLSLSHPANTSVIAKMQNHKTTFFILVSSLR